mgnify:CR=1 FL=1
MRKTILTFALVVVAYTASAQNDLKGQPMQPIPHKVENIELKDLRNNPMKLPFFGEKNIIFFYIDPDKHKQNEEFTYEMERRHTATGPNIEGFGVLNLKDTMLPSGIVRTMARKRTEKNGATVLADTDRTLAKAWGLGDCNNQFVLMLVSKDGEMLFLRKGELTEEDKAEFYRVVKLYR